MLGLVKKIFNLKVSKLLNTTAEIELFIQKKKVLSSLRIMRCGLTTVIIPFYSSVADFHNIGFQELLSHCIKC